MAETSVYLRVIEADIDTHQYNVNCTGHGKSSTTNISTVAIVG